MWLLKILCAVTRCGHAGRRRAASPIADLRSPSAEACEADPTGHHVKPALDGERDADRLLIEVVLALPWTARAAFLGGPPWRERGLAANRRWRDRDGVVRKDVLFIDCTAYGTVAETLAAHQTKGRPVHVEGT